MYGLVLMAALATAPDVTAADGAVPAAPAPVVVAGGTGCVGSSCFGSSCFGSSCYGSSCYGSSCYGSSCHGRSLFPLFPGLRARLSSRGCWSSCHGCYGSSCYGSSCFGSSCCGWSTYIGSIYGSGCTGYTGTRGVTYYSPTWSTGCTGCLGLPVGSTGTVGSYGHVTLGDSAVEYAASRSKPTAAPARLTIDLPADAKLFVDGTATKGEGTVRNFHTPDLPQGQSFYYELKAEVMIDGKPVTESRKVIVKAGDALSESFPTLTAAVKAAQSVASK